MIQLLRGTSEESTIVSVNLYDKFTNPDLMYNPMLIIKSQQTGKEKAFCSYAGTYTNKERYVRFGITVVTSEVAENKSQGKIYLGTTDYPYGFYDVKIYENKSNTNFSLSGVYLVFTTLMNLTETGNPAVTYTEYTTNDSDTESVYITNDNI